MNDLAVPAPMDLASFQAKAAEAAGLLRLMGHPARLMVLCKLAGHGELTAGELTSAVGLSQSALSQHLGKLREDGLITYRRERQTLWYRIASPRIATLMDTLYRLYCAEGPTA